MRTIQWLLVLPLQIMFVVSLQAQTILNGFVIEKPLVPINLIQQGGPPKDGIPALSHPTFVKAAQAKQLDPFDRVLGLAYQGEVKAYPIRILDHHEIVNDVFDQQKVVISFCPLCGTGMGFHANVNGQDLNFGVSGLLYNSDVLMYDQQTLSLWSQMDQQAISGKYKGKTLTPLPIEHTTWEDWKTRHPNTKVLSFDTGHSRNYRNTPYAGYETSESLYFSVSHYDKRYHPKEVTLGLQVNGQFKAYPFSELAKTKSPLTDVLNGQSFTLYFDMETLSGRVEDSNGQAYPVLSAYWFAWFAFHPETRVFSP